MSLYASLLLSLALGAVAQTTSNSTYDYIVAGGGPAGIIVAERIAESGASVLLLERGQASTYASGGRDTLSWNNTVTQYDVPGVRHYIKKYNDTSEYCTDTADAAACILGGGSMVNQLVFVPPQDIDFDDNWPTGWKWTDIASAADRVYQRNPGTITPSSNGLRYDQSSYTAFANFFSAHGWSSVDPISNPNQKQDVFSYPPWNIQNGLNAGPVMTYLPSAKAVSSFELRLNTKVVRVVRNGSLISGVEVENSTGERQIISVKNGGRVILASGTLSTPRILFNSGIGPVDQIQTVASSSNVTNVTLPSESDWISLPVGQGVKDHPIVTVTFNSTTAVDFPSTATFITPSSSNVELFDRGEGILTQGYQRLTFWTSANISDGSTRYFQGTCYASAANTVQIKVYLTHGLTSSGTLGITSAGNTVFETEPHLNTAGDKEALATFIDTLIAWSRKSNATLIYGGAANDTGASLITTYSRGSHWVGSAKMGTDDGRIDNGTSVVDLDTKVYGTDNLFVVDGSMHPDLPTGNLQAIVMVAAEAAAAKILALKTVPSASSSSASSSSTSVTTSQSTVIVGAGQSTASSSAASTSAHSSVVSAGSSSKSSAQSSKSSARSSIASHTTTHKVWTTSSLHKSSYPTIKKSSSVSSVRTSSHTTSSAKLTQKHSSSKAIHKPTTNLTTSKSSPKSSSKTMTKKSTAKSSSTRPVAHKVTHSTTHASSKSTTTKKSTTTRGTSTSSHRYHS
ncbi:hypothetical protein MBLNU459_g0492t1 [Dothideomycetes sp. NU459]